MTLRVPRLEVVSTITLRLGSSRRTRKMPAPPMPSRRFSTTSRCSSMNSCRSRMARLTREGTVNRENSAIANFSLWSRIARGALNTRAPCRSASPSSQVLATYSMSKGGSLRISVTEKSCSARVSDSCGRYQSSSLSVREIRVARALTLPFQERSCCCETKTWCPRICAARIMATVVSLYALSSSGGSMMKRIRAARLFRLRGHELDRGAHLGVGERRVAALRRHGALAFEHRLGERVHALLEARCPRRLVAQLGRAGDRLRVARDAGLVVHRLAVGRRGGLLRSSGFFFHCRLLEFSAGLVGHERHRPAQFRVGERCV